MSADPILNPNDCIVGVIYEGACRLGFIRINKDTTWTYVGYQPDFIEDIVHVEGQFYAVNSDSRLFILDSTSQFFSNKELTAHGIGYEEGDELKKTYLVKLNQKELLMVHRYVDFINKRRLTTKVKIFEWDVDKGDWVEKKTLGDVALFLGDNYSVPVLASNFPRCQANCIYFSHDYDRIITHSKRYKVRDFYMYNIEDQSFSKPYTKDAKTLMKKAPLPSIWIHQTFRE